MNRSKKSETNKKDGHGISGDLTKTIRLTDLTAKKTIQGGNQAIFGSGAGESKSKSK